MIKDLNKFAQKIIEKNQYVSIASSDVKGNPWISPVVYAYDNNWNFYFVSMPNSRHCQNIKTNKNVALAIFDSHQKWGQGVGLQIEGQAKVLNLKSSILASKIYAKRIYMIKPNTVYMNDPNSKLDVRVKIDLNHF